MSEIELGPFPKYETVRNNAYLSYIAIDSKFNLDSIDIGFYKEHLKDCEKNPTVGFIARNKYITGKKMNHPLHAKRNIKLLERQPEIDLLQKNIKNKINTLYPKTKNARQYIIKSGRISLDAIKKIKKYTIIDKLKICLKSFL